MKLLFDQNLSYRLVQRLADVYPDCQHVRHVGLKEAADSQVWDFAKSNGFVIVSKDSDFYHRSLVLGYTPKVIWLKLGNCTTQAVEHVLRVQADTVAQFEADGTATFLILSIVA